ncbi:MAG TPA: hypothetical protein ENI31_00120 [Candidatus Omnitrophica bacterium]|nr:hypothetical protein [Candidatus Omnitrophota bacterium]
MAREKAEICIGLPLDEVFRIAQTYPKFVKSYERSSVIYQDNSVLKVRVATRILGISVEWEGEGFKDNKKKIICFHQVSGPLKGLFAKWHFRYLADDKTKVIIESDFSIHVFLISIFLDYLIGKIIVKQIIKKILFFLKKECESKKIGEKG